MSFLLKTLIHIINYSAERPSLTLQVHHIIYSKKDIKWRRNNDKKACVLISYHFTYSVD